MAASSQSPSVVIGRREHVDLPEWGIERLLAKVDSGARTSALHVRDLEELEGKRLRFKVVLSLTGQRRPIEIETPWIRRTKVRSSSGKAERRYVVRTDMVLGPVRRKVEFTLTSREQMRTRMLLGRQAIRGDFLIDVGHAFVTERKLG